MVLERSRPAGHAAPGLRRIEEAEIGLGNLDFAGRARRPAEAQDPDRHAGSGRDVSAALHQGRPERRIAMGRLGWRSRASVALVDRMGQRRMASSAAVASALGDALAASSSGGSSQIGVSAGSSACSASAEPAQARLVCHASTNTLRPTPTTASPATTASAASSFGRRSVTAVLRGAWLPAIRGHAHRTVRQTVRLRRRRAYSPPPAMADPPATIAPAMSSGMPPAPWRGGRRAGRLDGRRRCHPRLRGRHLGGGLRVRAPRAIEAASRAVAASGKAIRDGRRRIGSPRSRALDPRAPRSAATRPRQQQRPRTMRLPRPWHLPCRLVICRMGAGRSCRASLTISGRPRPPRPRRPRSARWRRTPARGRPGPRPGAGSPSRAPAAWPRSRSRRSGACS